jgi:hypothetical protein
MTRELFMVLARVVSDSQVTEGWEVPEDSNTWRNPLEIMGGDRSPTQIPTQSARFAGRTPTPKLRHLLQADT